MALGLGRPPRLLEGQLVSVRYIGFLAEHSGYGEAARRHLLALAGTGVPVQARSVTLQPNGDAYDRLPSSDHRDVRRITRKTGNYQTVLVHTPAPFLPRFCEKNRHNIGILAWETSEIPRGWRAALSSVDQLWVPSGFCREAFWGATTRPVHVVPHPVLPVPDGPRELPQIPNDEFLFLAILEWSDRKNPDGLLQAFRSAFAGRRDVSLLLKAGLRFQPDAERIVRMVTRIVGSDGPRVYLCFDEMSPRALGHVMRRADAYVSLHRAEGFGLTLAEAMASGKPVVATNYSGNLEFMDRESAFLVDYRLVPLRERLTRGSWFERRSEWAEPDLDSAVEALRSCANSPTLRRRVAARGRAHVVECLSPARVGQRMRELLPGATSAARNASPAAGAE
jgi:glycosyltransferase involved in cell wall biosynthesis